MSSQPFKGFPPGARNWFVDMLGRPPWSQVADRAEEHENAVRAPMAALCAELADEFGPAHIWHLHRDPWLWSHQVAVVTVVDNIGLRVTLDLDALAVAGGWWTSSPDQVVRYREAVAGPAGVRLADIISRLPQRATIDGHRLARPPRSVRPNHPRVDLLRHRTLAATVDWPAGAWLHSREPLRRIRSTWRRFGPLTGWLGEQVGPRHSR
jgi:hypothetical protein